MPALSSDVKKAIRFETGCFVVFISAIIAIAYVVAMQWRYDDGYDHYKVSETPDWQKSDSVSYDGVRTAACAWLWSRLGEDRAWHSDNYAQLRGGKSLTSLSLLALMDVARDPLSLRFREVLTQLRTWVAADGSLGNDDPELPEYPNYATSLALQCLVLARDPQDKPLIARMTKYLVDQQYCEATGFGPEHVCYGGWGFGGRRPVGGSPGHMDIGHTRHVLQALRAAGHDDPQTYARAERFLRLLQKHPSETREQPQPDGSRTPLNAKPPYDGGFYFSPIVLAANKGGTLEHAGQKYFASYATCTCDGILALLACGVPQTDERIKAASQWLNDHPNIHEPEGVPKNTSENWRDSIQFYHYAVRAECYRALNWSGTWESDLKNGLRMEQRADGSFVNRRGFLMKEDDPLLCTALAVLALSYADRGTTTH
ncbi:MAG: hypothetical protein JNK76_19455 [Planctomycetales bacterium]|nr:hypothetical protein [Planctomycetales bacterium]MBN8624129.1 hypothetical protein [Planctomycetota bacterium]